MDAFAQLVPFGKYRGQDFAALLADTEYIQWLLSQSWFAERYPTIHMTIINNGGEPQETPEHNTMQLLFLEEALCRAAVTQVCHLMPRLIPEHIRKYLPTITPTSCDHYRYEVNGIDVSFQAIYRWEIPCTRFINAFPVPRRVQESWRKTASLEHQQEEERNYQSKIAALPEPYQRFLREGTQSEGMRLQIFRKDYGYRSYGPEEIGEEEYYSEPDSWIAPFNLELKPSLGDDYPAVLRQVLTACKRQQGYAAVICGTWAARGGTFAQVQQLFQRSGVALLPLTEIQACAETLR